MTNYEIYKQNNEMLCELIQPIIDVEENGSTACKLEYKYIETISMLSYNNRIFYEKNLTIKGNLITEGPNIYIVYFDPRIYYENVPVKVKFLLILV